GRLNRSRARRDLQGSARLALYDEAAHAAAAVLVRQYSTSFGLATRLLPPEQRVLVRDIYALVRLADVLVDGATAEAGGDTATARAALDALEERTELAMATGYSGDLLVHAFGIAARAGGIDPSLTRPFFASMRTDLSTRVHDEESLREYIHGSAEVVGLMCLRVFLMDRPEPERTERYAALAPGAQALGAAFQKVNFLRDLAEDADVLGRRYLVGIDPSHVTEEQKAAALADVDADLRTAAAAIDGLPPGARRAVAVAAALFTELTERIRRTPAAELSRSRIRVPDPVKARLAAGALLRTRKER
ncbi:phytoene/squalene synthase family protein, partial [Actinotalea sp.]|uniref:phytoene/squalene synthase family protein n=1 Tax=Actinotalea sp. TaxID=1872145 RepID=UPI0035639C31